jgi:HAE1 family hydrophobic/amphiphilic exporter-1
LWTTESKEELPVTTIRTALIQANHACLRHFDDNDRYGVWYVPYCISGWSRCEWKNGLAWVIIGGLISSLFLLIIVAIYEIMEN